MKYRSRWAGVGLGIGVGAAVSLPFALRWKQLKHRHARPSVHSPVLKAEQKPQNVFVIINPAKNQAQQAKNMIVHTAKRQGIDSITFLETTIDDPGKGQAQRAIENGADLVLVGGGDGTVNAVIQELSHTDVPLGVIPLGTGNLLARNIMLDVTDLTRNIAIALGDCQRYIDTSVLEAQGSTETIYQRFLVMSGIGLDAVILSDTSDDLKKRLGWLAYTEAGVRHLPGSRQWMDIVLDDGSKQRRKVRSVIFANCGIVPGGVDLLPDALIDDGILDVIIISPKNLRQWLKIARKIITKDDKYANGFDAYRVKKIKVQPAYPTEAEIDGEVIGKAESITCEVDPKSLLVKVA